MEEKNGGKRLAASSEKREKKQKTTPAIVAGVVAGVLLVGYLGLCAVAGGDKVWPHTRVMGIETSGLTFEEAADQVRSQLSTTWTGEPIAFVRDGQVVETLERGAYLEPVDVAERLRQTQESGFLTRGGRYLASLAGKGTDVTVPLDWTARGQEQVEGAIASLSQKLGVSGNETTYAVGETDITFTKGYTAARVDTGDLLSGVKGALISGSVSVPVTVEEAPPADPDFEAVAAAVHTDAADAYLDRESGEVVEAVVGRNLDIDAARLALAATAEGKSCTVPLDLTQPALTTEAFNALLFRDVLAEAVTHVTGTSDRVGNIKHAASFVNGSVVFPDEEFSFNQHCSPYSMANGYGKATAYVNGLSVDTVAGGICQASSTLYWASLKANLATLERNAHRYEPSYIKGGLDATVYGNYGSDGSLDFRFKNTTAHPIKVEEYVDSKNYIHAVIRGTDETGIHGEPYSTNRVVTQAYKTIYQANSSIPQGTTQRDKERTGYTGANIDTYQKLVDRDGNTVSETKLYTSKYHVRDEIIYFNPADLQLWGIDPVTGIRNPANAVTPTPAADPAQSVLEPTTDPGTLEPSGGEETTAPAAETPNVVESVQPSQEPVTPPEEEPLLPQAAATKPPMEYYLPVQPTPAPVPESVPEAPGSLGE